MPDRLYTVTTESHCHNLCDATIETMLDAAQACQRYEMDRETLEKLLKPSMNEDDKNELIKWLTDNPDEDWFTFYVG